MARFVMRLLLDSACSVPVGEDMVRTVVASGSELSWYLLDCAILIICCI